MNRAARSLLLSLLLAALATPDPSAAAVTGTVAGGSLVLAGDDQLAFGADLAIKAGRGDDTVELLNGTTVQGAQLFDLGGGINTVTQ